jgi:hypothetical protein
LERRVTLDFGPVVTFQLVVDLAGRLADEEQPPQDQDQVAARNAELANVEQRCGQSHHPAQA